VHPLNLESGSLSTNRRKSLLEKAISGHNFIFAFVRNPFRNLELPPARDCLALWLLESHLITFGTF